MDQVAPTTNISVLGFVPALVVQYLQALEEGSKSFVRTLPEKQSLTSVVMFADISGFTNLTETLSKIGPEGAEVIAFAINRYMELLVKGIGRSGGDIFKFAGDAMIVIWPPPTIDMTQTHLHIRHLQTLCKQAIQSALDLQNTLNDTNILENVKLSVKIGFGIGEVNIIHVGGVFQRTEYIATGDPLTQAFASEHCASEGGQTIISQQVYDLVEGFFDFQQVQGKQHYFVQQVKKNYEKVRMKADALLIKNNINKAKFELMRKYIYPYIPKALLPYMYIDQERWSSELRRLSILFVNLGIDLSDAKSTEGLLQIQKAIETVQKCIYMHEGSLNKLLMDDKGSTLIIVFGLPPMAHQDDAVRAVLTAFSLQHQLNKINCSCAVGISTGTVFAGVVGTSGSRREYSVLGDQVNLAARLMQQACTDESNKIIICQETAQTCEHQIASHYYKSVMLKGKNDSIPLYIPLDHDIGFLKLKNKFNLFPELKTHRNNFPVFPNIPDEQQSQTAQKTVAQELFMVGRDDQYRAVQTILDKFMKGPHRHGLITIRGTFGAGKTLFLRRILHRIQDKINSNQYPLWKYGERGFIMVSRVGPISQTLKFCGLRSILRGFFEVFANRVGREPNEELLKEMITVKPENTDHFELLKEVLGLKYIDMIANFPPKPEIKPKIPNEKEQEKILNYIMVDFLQYYFEEIPEKFKNHVEEKWFKWSQQSRLEDLTKSQKVANSIAPVIMCFDDTHYYDELTFRFIKFILKQYNFVMCIALIRDQYAELQQQPAPAPQQKGVTGSDKKKSQEETFIEGMAELEGAIDEQGHVHSFFLRGLQRNDKDDEFLKLIRLHFNINAFVTETPQKLDVPDSNQPSLNNIEEEKGRKRAVSTIPNIQDVTQQEKLKKELQNYFLFFENKATLFKKDIPLLFTNYVFLKSGGNSHIALNMIQQTINMKLLKIVNGKAMITNQLIKILSNEELILLDAPICRVQVNGPIIDKLSCQEQLLLKVASVIGDIFDVQTLAKIQPFKTVIDNEKLLKILHDLEHREVIEIMEMNEYNKYYRFSHSFFRECLYQRMTFAQRRQLHKSVAEAIQTMPQVYESEEAKEGKRLEFHWTIAETKWSLESPKENDKLQTLPTRDMKIFSKFVRQQTVSLPLKSTSAVSYKAMRSIILKSIQNKLSRSNNDTNTIIKEGFLEKKSDKNITWAKRYCVMDGREFRYYYTQQEAIQKREPLSSILLKHIYAIEALDENDRINKFYSFQLSCTSWIKKQKEMNERKFFFAAENEESLESWTIYIEFAKAKAVYDEFVFQFGRIQFPLGSQTDGFDQSIRFDVSLKKKRPLNTQQTGIEKAKSQGKASVMYRHSRISNFTMTHKMKFNSVSNNDEQAMIQNNMLDLELLKERMKVFLEKSTLLFYSHVFDMSIQRQDEYKVFGQSNTVVMKFNHLFKIEKRLLDSDDKISNAKLSVMSNQSLRGSQNNLEEHTPKLPEINRRHTGADVLQRMILQSAKDLDKNLLNGTLEEIEEEDMQRDEEEFTRQQSATQDVRFTESKFCKKDTFAADSPRNSLPQQQVAEDDSPSRKNKAFMQFTSKLLGQTIPTQQQVQTIAPSFTNQHGPTQKEYDDDQSDQQSNAFPSNSSEKHQSVSNFGKKHPEPVSSAVQQQQHDTPQLFESLKSKSSQAKEGFSSQSSQQNYYQFASFEPGEFAPHKHSGQHQVKQGDVDSIKSVRMRGSYNNSQVGENKSKHVIPNARADDHQLKQQTHYNKPEKSPKPRIETQSQSQVQLSAKDSKINDKQEQSMSVSLLDQNKRNYVNQQIEYPHIQEDNLSRSSQSKQSIESKKMERSKQLEPPNINIHNPSKHSSIQSLSQEQTYPNQSNHNHTAIEEPIKDKQYYYPQSDHDEYITNSPFTKSMVVESKVFDVHDIQQHHPVTQDQRKPKQLSVVQLETQSVISRTDSTQRTRNQDKDQHIHVNLIHQSSNQREFDRDQMRNDSSLSAAQLSLHSNQRINESDQSLRIPAKRNPDPLYQMSQEEYKQEPAIVQSQYGNAQQAQFAYPYQHPVHLFQPYVPAYGVYPHPQHIPSQYLQQSQQFLPNPYPTPIQPSSSASLNQDQPSMSRSDASPVNIKKKKKKSHKKKEEPPLLQIPVPPKQKSSSSQSRESFFGQVVKNCHSLRGDSFFVQKGDKVIVQTYKENPNYVKCSLGQLSGIFEAVNIKVLTGWQIGLFSATVEKDQNNSHVQQKQENQDYYQNLLASRLNRSVTPVKKK